MAELSPNYPTLLDLLRSQNPDRTMATVAPLLLQKNPIIGHIKHKKANDGLGELTTVESSLPQAYLATYNEVIGDSKGTNVQVRDTMAIQEQWSKADERLAKASGDIPGYRADQLNKQIAAMSNETARLIFYGNASVSPKECTGLSIRFSDTTAGNSRNLIDAGGTGSDNTSAWFIKHGMDGLMGIVPDLATAGIDVTDFGVQPADQFAGQTGNIALYKERLQRHIGLSLKDWRNCARVAGIDVPSLRARVNDADLIDLLSTAYYSLESTEGVYLYVNRTFAMFLDKQRRAGVAAGGELDYAVVDGKRVPAFREIPLFVCDGIVNTEAGV
jgi:hypothetical protein